MEQFIFDIVELSLKNITVTLGTAVPFSPYFLPAPFYGREPYAAVGSVIEEYEIPEQFFIPQAFASQQVAEKSSFRMYDIHILRCIEIFNSVHCHNFQ